MYITQRIKRWRRYRRTMMTKRIGEETVNRHTIQTGQKIQGVGHDRVLME